MAEAPKLRFGIIGAGMLGLTLAYRLSKLGHQVIVFEAAETIGGQTSTWQLGNLIWDRHYHVISLDDTLLLTLLQELGLSHKIHWRPTQTGFYANGKLHSLSNIRQFLKFPVISLWDKCRLGLTLLRAASLKNLRVYEQQTSITWLTRWSGKNTTEKLWSPLLQSKFGSKFSELSAAFIISNIQRMFGARKGASKQEVFGYVEGGYATILTALHHKLEMLGTEFRFNAPVQHIQHTSSEIAITAGTDTIHIDRAIITSAAPLVPHICPDLTSEEKQRLSTTEYLGIVCISLLLEQPISPYYITNILDRWVPYTGIIEMSALVDKKEFGGLSLVYLPRYLPSTAPELKSNEDLQNDTLTMLERMYPAFNRTHLRSFKVSRVPYILPLPTAQLQQNPLPIATSLPGIYTLNTGHITDGVLTVNKIMALADSVFPLLAEFG